MFMYYKCDGDHSAAPPMLIYAVVTTRKARAMWILVVVASLIRFALAGGVWFASPEDVVAATYTANRWRNMSSQPFCRSSWFPLALSVGIRASWLRVGAR
jgi:hypothetical protein